MLVACLLPPTQPYLDVHWHAQPWENEARLQRAKSSSLTVLIILLELHFHHDTFCAMSRPLYHGEFS